LSTGGWRWRQTTQSQPTKRKTRLELAEKDTGNRNKTKINKSFKKLKKRTTGTSGAQGNVVEPRKRVLEHGLLLFNGVHDEESVSYFKQEWNSDVTVLLT